MQTSADPRFAARVQGSSADDGELRDTGLALFRLLLVWLVLMLGCAQIALALAGPAEPVLQARAETRTFLLPPVEAMHDRPEKHAQPEAALVMER
ncbi:MAG: hypothetical protein EOO24_08295 [Comamonadaceae bacterium]|nr:MAG: hypothetical protein EOO24_08295 [Comamonadaceae bacterium]